MGVGESLVQHLCSLLQLDANLIEGEPDQNPNICRVRFYYLNFWETGS